MTDLAGLYDFDEHHLESSESGSGGSASTLARRVTVVFVIAAAIVGLIAGASVDVTAEDDSIGVLASLPVLYWVAVALAIVVTSVVLWDRSSGGRNVLVLLVPLWLALLHVAPALALVDTLPAGSLQTVADSGRMSNDGSVPGDLVYPSGFSGLVSVLIADAPAALWQWAVRLWPALITAVTALLVSALASRSYPRTSFVGPLAALVYVLIAWFETGYLGSTAVGVGMLLAVLVLIESGPLQGDKGSVAGLAVRSRQAESLGDRTESSSVPTFVALLLTIFGAIVGDEVVPAAICGVLAVLALYGRTVGIRLWLVAVIVYTAWSVLAEEPWWSGELGQVGSRSGQLLDGVMGGDASLFPGEQAGVWAGLIVLIIPIMVGLLMMRPGSAPLRPTMPLVPLALVCLFAVLIPAPADRWGGLMVACVAPFTAILIARLFSSEGKVTATVAVPLLAAVAVPVFLLVRFGAMAETSPLGQTHVVVVQEQLDEQRG